MNLQFVGSNKNDDIFHFLYAKTSSIYKKYIKIVLIFKNVLTDS